MMEKAFECALQLKSKHEFLGITLLHDTSISKKKKLIKLQDEIAKQILDFLEDIQEFKSVFMLNHQLKSQYISLVNYFSKQIHTRIFQIQTELDFKIFETKLIFQDLDPNCISSNQLDIENIQEKLSTYYQFFKN